MSDDRTAEQRKADAALTAAIDQVRAAYYGEPEASVLMEYVVVASRQSYADDGEPESEIALMPRDGNQPLHRLLGLIGYADVRYRKMIGED